MDELRWKKDKLKTVYARESFPDEITKSIFLAGPTPRELNVKSWRSNALTILESLDYDGHIFIPEPRDGKWLDNYDSQIEWEEEGLHRADLILFWVPRDPTGSLKGSPLPAFTTNIEWGEWKNSGKVIWAAPDWALNTRYPSYYAKKLGVQHTNSLEHSLQLAIEHLGQGALRRNGECHIPLHIWKKKEFQAWLKSQRDAGNRLDGARVLWTFQVKPKVFFSYILQVNVHIASEGRNKTNEFVFARSDVSSVLLYHHPDNNLDNTKIVLVREFMSPARTTTGFVHELPGGSSVNELTNPLGVAASEVEEETGLKLNYSRFKRHESRQLLATLSIHKSSLFSCELTAEEIAYLELDKTAHGNFTTDSEMTFIEVKTLQEIIEDSLVDWSTLGMILSVII